ncbi:hypothetical protein DSECCO2_585920 [anaerobic digester metagenome]
MDGSLEKSLWAMAFTLSCIFAIGRLNNRLSSSVKSRPNSRTTTRMMASSPKYIVRSKRTLPEGMLWESEIS